MKGKLIPMMGGNRLQTITLSLSNRKKDLNTGENFRETLKVLMALPLRFCSSCICLTNNSFKSLTSEAGAVAPTSL